MTTLQRWPELLNFLNSLNVVFEPYHGTTLEGNEVTKVMRSLGHLESLVPAELLPFVDTMRAFYDVVESTFGYTLDPFYENCINNFKLSFETLQGKFQITETVKVHMIKNHVQQYITMTGRSLGTESEQALENAHSSFQVIWNKYKVKNSQSEIYKLMYFRAIMNFNGDHI